MAFAPALDLPLTQAVAGSLCLATGRPDTGEAAYVPDAEDNTAPTRLSPVATRGANKRTAALPDAVASPVPSPPRRRQKTRR